MRKEIDAIERAAYVIAIQGIYESPEGEDEKTQEAVDAAEVFDAIVRDLPEEKQPWRRQT